VVDYLSVHLGLSDDLDGPLDGVPRDVMTACASRHILVMQCMPASLFQPLRNEDKQRKDFDLPKLEHI
jgi:hypothetical protein